MLKKSIITLTLLLFAAGLVGLNAAVRIQAEPQPAGTRCSEYFTNCTDGGCANFVAGSECEFICTDADGDEIEVTCTKPDATTDVEVKPYQL